ncbi:MAG: NAD-dependent epimerase/dehydratase family protein [Mycobacterium sp.]|nr:NAD-dependent epimerase/dehydratase family protein [Mycobacterium sp.]
MRALVTGAAGFIGSHLALRLTGEGHRVVGVDSFTDYYDVAMKRARADAVADAGASVVEADLNTADLDELIDGVDVVFHLAGQPGIRASWGTDFLTYTRCNISATQKLLEATRGKAGLRRLVFASSSSVYGDAERFPTIERYRPQPVSPYGVTKLAAEHLCALYATNFGVPSVCLRYFTVYGPGQRPDMAFARFTEAALTGQEIVVFGSGEQVRDFTFVDDVVEATILAATREVSAGSVLNVAGGSPSSVNDVLGILEGLVGRKLPVLRQDAVAGDMRRTGGDTAAIRSELGWQPRIGLRDGLALQLAWAEERRGTVPAVSGETAPMLTR